MDWQSPILCICISDIINVLRALQRAKPKLDVLGVVVLMLCFKNHYYSYINYFILFESLGEFGFVCIFFVLHWLFNLWLSFSTFQ